MKLDPLLPRESLAALRGVRKVECAFIGAQVSFLVLTRLVQPPIYVDDAYIHFRNALNWSRGEGLLFNPGEWVFGTTSPIYALLLGVVNFVTNAPIPAVARAVNFTADLGILALVLVWLSRAGVPLAFRHALALVLAADPWMMVYSSAGMEMSLFILMILGSLEAFHRGRWLAAGLVLGPMGWVRPEAAIVWTAVAAGLLLARRRDRALRGFAVAVGAASVFALTLFVAYGSFMPQSMFAKAAAPWFRAGGGARFDFFFALAELTPFSTYNVFRPVNGFLDTVLDRPGLGRAAAIASLQLALILAGSVWLWLREQRLFVTAWLGSLVGWYVFYAVGDVSTFTWYYAPYDFAALLLGGCGWWALFDWIRALSRRREVYPGASQRPLNVVFATAFLLISLMTVVNQAVGTGLFRSEPEVAWRLRYAPAAPDSWEMQYIEGARLLNERIGNRISTRVGCAEIGVFGYYFNGLVLDSYGLVSPEAVAASRPEALAQIDPASRDIHPLNIYMALRPDYIFTLDHFLQVRPAAFDETYRQVPAPELDKILIFERRGP